MIPASRPQTYNNAKLYSDDAYVGWVRLPGEHEHWSRGLVARRNIPKGTVIAEYTGKILQDANSSSDYLMSATSTDGTVVIDGDPKSKYSGMASYANYAPWTTANSFFIDDLTSKLRTTPSYRGTYIVLVAKHDIPSGQEIRCDYDTASMGDYRKKLIHSHNVNTKDLDSNEYLYKRWQQPHTLGRYVKTSGNKINNVSALSEFVGRCRLLKRKRGRPSAREHFIQF